MIIHSLAPIKFVQTDFSSMRDWRKHQTSIKIKDHKNESKKNPNMKRCKKKLKLSQGSQLSWIMKMFDIHSNTIAAMKSLFQRHFYVVIWSFNVGAVVIRISKKLIKRNWRAMNVNNSCLLFTLFYLLIIMLSQFTCDAIKSSIWNFRFFFLYLD